MSAERHHEHEARHEQQHAELQAERERRLETLRAEHQENGHEKAEDRAERAREVIHHQAEHAPKPAEHEAAPHHPMHQVHHLLNHKLNYQQTLSSIQRKLKPASRNFSKFIHQPAVERASDIVGNTVARPSVAAGASWTALIVGGLFYFTARRYGYTLSGSEIIVSLLVGGLLGLVLEGAWRATRRR
jgi:hypothetical protein